MMFIAKLPVNQAWALLFGDPKAHPMDWSLLDLDGRRLWPTEESLLDALAEKGLAAAEDTAGGYAYVVLE